MDEGELYEAEEKMKSGCGLPAKSGSTKCCISREEENIRTALAYGLISFRTYEKKYRELKKQGLIWRR